MAARGFTATFQSVAALADRALRTQDGLTIFFDLDTYHALDACARASRSFQTTFASLRAQERRREHIRQVKRNGGDETYDIYRQGTYDALACHRYPLPDDQGWKVELVPASTLFDAWNVVDRATGEPLQDIGKAQSELTRLQFKYAQDGASFSKPNRRRALTLDPFFFTNAKDDGSMPSEPWVPPHSFLWDEEKLNTGTEIIKASDPVNMSLDDIEGWAEEKPSETHES